VTPTPRQFAFQDPGLDRAEHLREDAAALDAAWPAAKVMLLDAEGHARFLGAVESPEFPLGAALASERHPHASFLGQEATGAAWFALPAAVLRELPAQCLDLRSAASQWPAATAAIFAQARALLHWHQRNRYCGGCGHELVFARGGFCARCDQCGLEHYPRTDPAIIVAVSDGQHLLLGRQASWPAGRWSVLAGFLEPGESLEQTVAREVMEEAGVRVRAVHYLASQPWPFPSSLMLGFRAEADPQPAVVGDELEEARWFAADELRALIASGQIQVSPRLSISRWLIDDWLARH